MSSSNGTGSGLQFVNVTPTTQAERLHNQRIIRSAAMRTFRRDQKLQRLKDQDNYRKGEEKGKPEPVLRQNEFPGESDGDFVSKSADIGEWLTRSGCPPTSASDADDAATSSEFNGTSPSRWGASPQRALSIMSSPVTTLGAGRVDPFQRYPVTGPHVNEIMDHAVTFIWPGFRPVSQAVKTRLAYAWFEKCTQRPLVMHAMLFGGSVHRDMLRNPRQSLDNSFRLFHKGETMRLLNASLQAPAEVSLDDLILAVLALSTNEVETMATNINMITPPFNSPLGSIQWLDVYGRMLSVHAHASAMYSLVARRGGLEKVEIEGLPEVLSLSDILGATQSLSKPQFPFLDRWVHRPLSPGQGLDPQLPQSNHGCGFRELIGYGINETALNVFEAMAAFTQVIDSHCRGLMPISDMALFIDNRNHVQHRLMTLPTGEELKSGQISRVCMYEGLRLAAMIFSVAVIFPIPPSNGIFQKLSSRLKTAIDESNLDRCWRLYPKTLLWMLVLGGIAALDTDDRVWYVYNLAAVSSALKLSEWEDVTEGLRQYLWLDSACTSGCRTLWLEVTGRGCWWGAEAVMGNPKGMPE